jgi:hypothetical protein
MAKAGQLSQHSAWGYWPDDSSIVLRFPPRAIDIPSLQASKMALGPTHPNVRGVTMLFRGVKQNAQLHIVQRRIMRGATPLRQHMASMKYSTFHLVACLVLVRSTVQISDGKSVITEGFRPISQSLLLYQLVYVMYMIYTYLTAIGLTPGGSSTVHIHTQTVHRTTQWDRIHRTEHTYNKNT